ncbi:hypothetical protein V2J09_021845 [Rumex salicifolius]
MGWLSCLLRYPLLLRLKPISPSNPARRPFRFLVAWMTHLGFSELIEATWDSEIPTMEALHKLREKLGKWNREVFGNNHLRKKKLIHRLQGIAKGWKKHASDHLLRLQRDLHAQLEKVLEEEEMLWYQKAKDKWVKYGDHNTKIFHASTIVRRKQSRIETLINTEGE